MLPIHAKLIYAIKLGAKNQLSSTLVTLILLPQPKPISTLCKTKTYKQRHKTYFDLQILP